MTKLSLAEDAEDAEESKLELQDLLVVLPFEGKPWRIALSIREQVHPGFPLDLLVRTEAQVADRLRHNDSFLSEIVTKGKVLYEG
jgi:uncharacterized protein